MSKHLHCVIPGCTWNADADSEEELLVRVAEHADHDHGVAEVSPELVEKVKQAIRDR